MTQDAGRGGKLVAFELPLDLHEPLTQEALRINGGKRKVKGGGKRAVMVLALRRYFKQKGV